MCIYHFWRHIIYCSSGFAKLKKKNIFGFSVVFSRRIAQISIFKPEYLENGLADFNDFGLILQDFGRPFRWNQLVLALQFSFKAAFRPDCSIANKTEWIWIQLLPQISTLRLIARITSSVQASLILYVFLGYKVSNIVKKIGCYRCLQKPKIWRVWPWISSNAFLNNVSTFRFFRFL